MSERKSFVVECKRCHRNVPTGLNKFPFESIAVTCPLCGEVRRYRPSEVSFARAHHLAPTSKKDKREPAA